MTTYNYAAVADAVIAFKKGMTIQQFRALRDMIIAVTEGSINAPKIVSDALDTDLADMALTGTFAGVSGLSARLKKVMFYLAGGVINSSSGSSVTAQIQLRASVDNGATWGSTIVVSTMVAIAGIGQTANDSGNLMIDLETGALRSLFGAGGTAALATAINAVQLRVAVTTGTGTTSGHLVILGASGVSP